MDPRSMPKPKGRTRSTAGEMNKLEAAYADFLELLRRAGEVAWFEWDCLSIRLADSTHYRIDFLVMQKDGTLEVHEVKGNHMEDDAWVKLKILAEKYPFPVKLIRKIGKEWSVTEVGMDAKASVKSQKKVPLHKPPMNHPAHPTSSTRWPK